MLTSRFWKNVQFQRHYHAQVQAVQVRRTSKWCAFQLNCCTPYIQFPKTHSNNTSSYLTGHQASGTLLTTPEFSSCSGTEQAQTNPIRRTGVPYFSKRHAAHEKSCTLLHINSYYIRSCPIHQKSRLQRPENQGIKLRENTPIKQRQTQKSGPRPIIIQITDA